MDTRELLAATIRRIVCERDFSPLPPEAEPFFRKYLALHGGDQMRFAAFRIRGMRQQAALRELTARFQEKAIRFCTIKGADLTWRVWPSEIVRCSSDLDVWIHPEDFKKALETAHGIGWNSPYPYYRNDHHAPTMRRHDASLELHYRLPLPKTVKQDDLWAELAPGEGSERHLPLELNLLLLFHHSRGHIWNNGVKLLLDSGFLVAHEGAPDWERMKTLTAQLKIAGPEVLFSAFPELFPVSAMPVAAIPADTLSAFRSLILSAPCSYDRMVERTMSERDRFSPAWWRERLRRLSPSVIRQETRNPHGRYGQLTLDWCRIFLRKAAKFWRWRHGTKDGELLRRMEKERLLEAFLDNVPNLVMGQVV